MRRFALAVLAVVLLGTGVAVVLVVTGGDSGTDAGVNAGGESEPEQQLAEPVATGTYGVATDSFTFVDDERVTPAFGTLAEQPTRTIVTDVWYPDGVDGPFPLIVFNHGQQGEPQQYAPAFETWASAGYVVAAPRHPLSVRGGPGALFAHDIYGEIGDVPFTITMVGEELSGLVDMEHIAVAGHSSGAIVSLAVGFNTCCHDDRVDAILTGSARIIPFDGEYSADLRGTPVLFVHGTRDVSPIAESQRAFDAATAPRFFYTVEGGDHSDMFRSALQAPLFAAAGLEFFDLTLKGDDEAVDALAAFPGMVVDAG